MLAVRMGVASVMWSSRGWGESSGVELEIACADAVIAEIAMRAKVASGVVARVRV